MLLLGACSSSRTGPATPPGVPLLQYGKEDPRPRNVVILLVDALRADALQVAHTPVLTELSRRSLVVDRAWSGSSWTVPSVVSLLTGSFCRTHQWNLPAGDVRSAAIPPVLFLPEVLKKHGFTTHGLHNSSYLAMEIGFGRGFDEWRHTSDILMPKEVGRVVKGWQDPAQADARNFLYIHLIGPHSGLNPSPEARARWKLDDSWFEPRHGLLIGRAKRGTEPGVREAYKTAYYAVVEDVDARVGEVLDALGPVMDQTLLIVSADHGEELGETGVFEHGWSVAEALVHVPLLLSGPGVKPGRRPTATMTEMADMVTDAVGLDVAWPVQSPWDGPLAAERHGRMAILADGRWKGAWLGRELTVYDLEADPAGLTPTSDPAARERVMAARKTWMARVPEGPPLSSSVELDPRTIEAIRALGYLE